MNYYFLLLRITDKHGVLRQFYGQFALIKCKQVSLCLFPHRMDPNSGYMFKWSMSNLFTKRSMLLDNEI